MDTDQLETSLMLADTLASQSRMNEAVTRVLYSVSVTLEKADEAFAEHAEDIGRLAHEIALVNQRVESLTATVGRLLLAVEPTEDDVHSVKVPDA